MSDVDPEEEYADIFAQIDLDNDGKITFPELKLYMQDIGEFNEEVGKGDAYVKAIINEADIDKDGGLDYQEFCYMMLAR
jgi:Ca2+-binding EF-hand superfamily protein